MDKIAQLKQNVGLRSIYKSRDSIKSDASREISVREYQEKSSNGDENADSLYGGSSVNSEFRSRSLQRRPSVLMRLNSKIKDIRERSES